MPFQSVQLKTNLDLVNCRIETNVLFEAVLLLCFQKVSTLGRLNVFIICTLLRQFLLCYVHLSFDAVQFYFTV